MSLLFSYKPIKKIELIHSSESSKKKECDTKQQVLIFRFFFHSIYLASITAYKKPRRFKQAIYKRLHYKNTETALLDVSVNEDAFLLHSYAKIARYGFLFGQNFTLKIHSNPVYLCRCKKGKENFSKLKLHILRKNACVIIIIVTIIFINIGIATINIIVFYAVMR